MKYREKTGFFVCLITALLLLLLIAYVSGNGGDNNTDSVPVTVPDVVGQAQTAAQREITSAGLTVGRVTQEYSLTIASGNVIRQSPAAGAPGKPGAAVNLIVSRGADDAVTYQSTTYYVSPSGSDKNDGLSENNPLKDLAKAIYRMGMGDTLIVLPGEYELVDFSAWCRDPYKNRMYLGPEGGSAVVRTTIKGKSGQERPRITARNSAGYVTGLTFNNARGLTLEHLDVHGGVGYGTYMIYRDCVIGGEGTVYAISAGHHNALIENNYIHDIYGGNDAIGIYISGNDNIIRGNFFKNMEEHAINSNTYGSGKNNYPSSGWIIEQNYITQTGGHGIGLQNVQNSVIRNNILVNIGSQAISFGGNVFPDKNIKIIGNTIYNFEKKGFYGFFFINEIDGIFIANNILVHHNPVAFLHPDTQLSNKKMQTYTFRNNIYYNPASKDGRLFITDEDKGKFLRLKEWQEFTAKVLGDGIGLDQGSKNVDPLVISPPYSVNDYLEYDIQSHINMQLTGKSPAIDAGMNVDLSHDIIGNTRPQNEKYDIGAYEYIGK